MSFVSTRIGQSSLVYLLLFIVCFVNVYQNAFSVTSDWWFDSHSLPAERYVLDGIMHMQKTGNAPVSGYFDRGTGWGFEGNPRDFYTEKNTSDIFHRYPSSYGLQTKFYGLVAALGADELHVLYAFSSVLMSLTIIWLVRVARQSLGGRYAMVVAFVFVLSPWLVVYGRSLYWMAFLWFIPIGIALHYAPKCCLQPNKIVIMCVWLFVAILVKALTGYEFISCIVLAPLVPLLYFAISAQAPVLHIVKMIVAVGVTSFFAVLVAAIIHINDLSETFGEGVTIFMERAERRLHSQDPEKTAVEAHGEDEEAAALLQESLTVSTATVIGQYLIMPEVLPWLSATHLSESKRQAFKAGFLKQDGIVSKILFVLQKPVSYWFYVAAKILNPLAFFLVMGIAFLAAIKLHLAWRVALLTALTSSLSWLVIAKGFCYIHEHLCYVIWYLPLTFVSLMAGMKLLTLNQAKA